MEIEIFVTSLNTIFGIVAEETTREQNKAINFEILSLRGNKNGIANYFPGD